MFWWARFIAFSLTAAFFLKFGIEEMGRAYQLRHPSEFLMSFFSSSFIILISGTLLVAFIWRMVLRCRDGGGPPAPSDPEKRNPP
ncbi:MAG: hypothetical protein HY697_03655 [Deltaproteobacteria bacterium]|nr:hypothetical protein [Deltaproteobacteria bacterium]